MKTNNQILQKTSNSTKAASQTLTTEESNTFKNFTLVDLWNIQRKVKSALGKRNFS